MRLNLQLFKGGNASGSGAETVDQTEARIADENEQIERLNSSRGTVEFDGYEFTHGTMQQGLETIKDVIDPETGRLPAGVTIEFHFADGHIETFNDDDYENVTVHDMPMSMGRSYRGGRFSRGVDGVSYSDGDGRFFFAGKGFSFQNFTAEYGDERRGDGTRGDLYHDRWLLYGSGD